MVCKPPTPPPSLPNKKKAPKNTKCIQGQGLYKSLGLPLPTEPAKTPYPILIYGGSTATGIFGIQFARASGLRVIATASPHNHEYLRSLGAEAVFDYGGGAAAAAETGAAIRALTGDALTAAWDCTGAGAELCAAALSGSRPSRLGAIMGVDAAALRRANPRVEGPLLTLGYTVFGEPCVFGGGRPESGFENVIPAQPDELEFARAFTETARALLADGRVRTVRPIVNRGGSAGLDGVLLGLDELRNARVSAGKLVYTL